MPRPMVLVDRDHPLEELEGYGAFARYRVSVVTILYLVELCFDVALGACRGFPGSSPTDSVGFYPRFPATGDFKLAVAATERFSQLVVSRFCRLAGRCLCMTFDRVTDPSHSR